MDLNQTIAEHVFSSILGHNVRIVNSGAAVNSMQNIREFISLLYKDTGFNFSYLKEQHEQQIAFDNVRHLKKTLHIRTPYEDSFPIKCSLGETIDEFKVRIEDEQGIDRQFQVLTFNDVRLSDGRRTLRDYKINNHDIVFLELQLKQFYVVIKLHRAIVKIFECSPKDTLTMIQRKLSDNLMIRNLVIESNLNMNDSLENMGVVRGTVLFARKPRFTGGNLSIKIPLGKAFWIVADSKETVRSLKRKIENVEHIPVDHQNLVYNGEYLEDKETLDFYEIQGQDTLQLVEDKRDAQIKVYIQRVTGERSQVDGLSLVETIKSLKAKIRDTLNVPVDLQTLVFNGKRVEDNSKTIFDCKIKDGDTIFLALKVAGQKSGDLKISVKTLSGTVYDLKLKSSNSVEDLKWRLNEWLNTTINTMVVMYRSIVLDDHETLGECGIHNDSLLHLLIRQNDTIDLMASNILAPQFHYDFTNIDDKGVPQQRGSLPYLRPCGWKRIAIAAAKQYENDYWLGHSNSAGEWPVAYHGTDYNKIQQIAHQGININQQGNNNTVFNKAHLVTPDIRTAEQFADVIRVNNKRVIFVIQSRVRPDRLVFNTQRDYILVPSYDDLRPYGICYKYLD